MNAKEIIKALEQKGLKEMKRLTDSDDAKIRVIRAEIARACKVGPRTVNNWACGSSEPGEWPMELLRIHSANRGVK